MFEIILRSRACTAPTDRPPRASTWTASWRTRADDPPCNLSAGLSVGLVQASPDDCDCRVRTCFFFADGLLRASRHVQVVMVRGCWAGQAPRHGRPWCILIGRMVAGAPLCNTLVTEWASIVAQSPQCAARGVLRGGGLVTPDLSHGMHMPTHGAHGRQSEAPRRHMARIRYRRTDGPKDKRLCM